MNPINVRLIDCIAPSFYGLHHRLKRGITKEGDPITELWAKGGRGSTKSSFISQHILKEIISDPEANAVVLKRYENEIRDSVYGQLQWAANKLGCYQSFTWNVSPYKITYTNPQGKKQVIVFKGADNPQKIKSINLGTGYIKYAWFEEVDQFGGMEEIRNILQSLFRGTTKRQTAVFSYNPPKSARSWVNQEVKIAKPGRIVHTSDYRDVPPAWLGETFITNAEHLKNTNEDAYNHEYLGMETGTGLEVFNNVTIRKITDKEISYFDRRYQGVDFGYAADPLCFLESHYDAKKRHLYIFDEISGIRIKNSQFATMLTDEQRAEITMADAAEPKSIDELRDDHHVNIIAAEKAPGSVDHGIKWLQDLEQIIIDPERCPLASTEFVNYALEVNSRGETISKYPDKDNHAIDATRYMMSLQITQARVESRKNKFKVRALPTISRW